MPSVLCVTGFFGRLMPCGFSLLFAFFLEGRGGEKVIQWEESGRFGLLATYGIMSHKVSVRCGIAVAARGVP